jgi:hypothetical protein
METAVAALKMLRCSDESTLFLNKQKPSEHKSNSSRLWFAKAGKQGCLSSLMLLSQVIPSMIGSVLSDSLSAYNVRRNSIDPETPGLYSKSTSTKELQGKGSRSEVETKSSELNEYFPSLRDEIASILATIRSRADLSSGDLSSMAPPAFYPESTGLKPTPSHWYEHYLPVTPIGSRPESAELKPPYCPTPTLPGTEPKGADVQPYHPYQPSCLTVTNSTGLPVEGPDIESTQ